MPSFVTISGYSPPPISKTKSVFSSRSFLRRKYRPKKELHLRPYAPYGRQSSHQSYLVLRHLSLQYFTSDQFFSHFLRHVNGRLHTKQILVGKFSFLIFFIIIKIYTATLNSRNVSLREVFISVLSLRSPIIKAQGT